MESLTASCNNGKKSTKPFTKRTSLLPCCTIQLHVHAILSLTLLYFGRYDTFSADAREGDHCDVVFRCSIDSTIIEMSDDCGPGEYAVACDMGVLVCDPTFDHDFTSSRKCADQFNVLVRVDRDEPGYWPSILAAKAGSKACRVGWYGHVAAHKYVASCLLLMILTFIC
jgi:hypothetical protein